jgi:hypothetical protein
MGKQDFKTRLIVTALTRDHGIQQIEVDTDLSGFMPEYASVRILHKGQEPSSFDPRKQWDRWTHSTEDPRDIMICVQYFCAGFYIQKDLPFMIETTEYRQHLRANRSRINETARWVGMDLLNNPMRKNLHWGIGNIVC